MFGNDLNKSKFYSGEIKSRLKSGHVCYHSVQSLLSSSWLSRNVKINVYRTIILPFFCMGVKLGRSH
jgi:hypothetical protein